MKPITSVAFALVMAASAGAAAAQDGYGGYASGPGVPRRDPREVTSGVMGSSKQDAAQQQSKDSKKAKEQPGIKPSAKAMKALIELQDAVNKNDVANIPAKVAAAQAVAQTKEDRYLIGQLQLKAALTANNDSAVAAAIDVIAASGFNDPKLNASLYESIGSTFFNKKQFAEAASAFQKAAAADPTNWHSTALVGEALFAQGQKEQAIAAFQRAIQLGAAGGAKPDENLVKRAVGIAYEAKSPMAVDLAQAWVGAYPSPNSWSDAIAIYRNYNLNDAETTIDLLKLKQSMGTLTEGEYGLLAQKLAEQLVFGQARAVVDAGVAANKLNPTNPAYKDLIAAIRAKAKPTAADLGVAMKAAANGKALMRIGDNYAAIGDTANAVAAYKAAMARPDGDAALANLHAGIALAQAGDKAGATAALNAVTGARAAIAKYWLIYLSQKA